MNIEGIYRVKGTILTGLLDFDVKVGQNLILEVDGEPHEVRLMGIERFHSSMDSEAKAGEQVALLFRGISHLNISLGNRLRQKCDN